MLRLCLLVSATAISASAIDYMEPAQALIDIVDAPWSPLISMSPDFQWCLLRIPQKNTTINDMAQPELKLAGMRFRPDTFAPTRTAVYTEMTLMNMNTLEIMPIQGLPENLRALSRAWSPDGSMVAFTNETSVGVELWVIDVESASARNLTGPVLNLTAMAWPAWLPSGTGILACLKTEAAGLPPAENPVPSGPSVQETFSREAPVRTLQDLLTSPYQEDLFSYYFTSRLAVVSLDGSTASVGEPGIIWDFDPAPGTEAVLVHRLHRPFSYSVSASDFPMLAEVIDLNGNILYTVADLPVRDCIPLARGSVYQGPRSIHWRADEPATLCWVEALDGGDAEAQAEFRDRVLMLEAPFTGEAVTLAVLNNRYGEVNWGTDSLALVSEWWWEGRSMRVWRVRPGNTAFQAELVFDYSFEDVYNDPGSPMTVAGAFGRDVLFSPDGASVFMKGDGASPEGNIPFVRRVLLDSPEAGMESVFCSQAPFYERPVSFADSTGEELLFLRESPEEYPNYFIRNLTSGSDRRITAFPHPNPQLRGISRELITYTREDGLNLSGLLYTPSGYSVEDGPLPVVMWAYPEDFASAAAASRITSSPYEFDYIGWWSPLIWLTKGYAVLDYPSMPIVGADGAEPNDTYIEQLVMNAEAAVNSVVETGVGDRDRFVIGGHSYGAFMAANLLAHTDLFAAGIASTGAYNRTLTPFGFQSEDRSLWEAPEVYLEMSPFMFADRINEPILILHGSDDNNSGTFPIQSERLFGAIKGLGGTARLVMLPLEGHIYSARESVLHYLWETSRWLDMYAGP